MQKRILGIDAGSVTVSVVEIDLDGKLLNEIYEPHLGKPASRLFDILAKKDFDGIVGVARTSTAPDLIKTAVSFDSRVAMIAGSRSRYPHARLNS